MHGQIISERLLVDPTFEPVEMFSTGRLHELLGLDVSVHAKCHCDHTNVGLHVNEVDRKSLVTDDGGPAAEGITAAGKVDCATDM